MMAVDGAVQTAPEGNRLTRLHWRRHNSHAGATGRAPRRVCRARCLVLSRRAEPLRVRLEQRTQCGAVDALEGRRGRCKKIDEGTCRRTRLPRPIRSERAHERRDRARIPSGDVPHVKAVVAKRRRQRWAHAVVGAHALGTCTAAPTCRACDQLEQHEAQQHSGRRGERSAIYRAEPKRSIRNS